MIDINLDLLQWFTIFFKKKSSGGAVTRANKSAIKSKMFQTSNQQKNYTSQLLKSLKNEKYTHYLKTLCWDADLANM